MTKYIEDVRSLKKNILYNIHYSNNKRIIQSSIYFIIEKMFDIIVQEEKSLISYCINKNSFYNFRFRL